MLDFTLSISGLHVMCNDNSREWKVRDIPHLIWQISIQNLIAGKSYAELTIRLRDRMRYIHAYILQLNEYFMQIN